VKLFARQGYAATGIRDIAREARLNSATLYHYSSSKEQLLLAIMRTGQQQLNDAAVLMLTGRERPEDQLAQLVGGLVATHAMNPRSTRVIDHELVSLDPGSEGRRQVVALRDTYEQLWSNVLQQGIDDGVFDIDDAHLSRLALITMCTGMSNWFHRSDTENLRHVRDQYVDLALGAVRAKRGRRQVRAAQLPAADLKLVPSYPWEPSD
jgi:AcrR family transcriptional regulator